jgi:hypothetical protein
MSNVPHSEQERPLTFFQARRALSGVEKLAVVISALILVQLWSDVLGLVAEGSPWGRMNFKFQWVGTHQLAIVATFATVAWLVVVWRHIVSRLSSVRRALNLPPLTGVVLLHDSPESGTPQKNLF